MGGAEDGALAACARPLREYAVKLTDIGLGAWFGVGTDVRILTGDRGGVELADMTAVCVGRTES